jgi:type IV secretion/conjugal transfer VirB4 family ATPase
MLRIRRILRDYEEAGSLNSLIALWGFVDDHIFLTKAGHLGIVYRVAGVDFECLDRAQRRDTVHRFEAALRSLHENCRLYQYLAKRRILEIKPTPCRQHLAHEAVQRRADYLNARRSELFELDLHFVLMYEGMRPRGSSRWQLRHLRNDPRAAIRGWLLPSTTMSLIEADLDRAIGQLKQKASAFEVQLADSIRPNRLEKTAAFQFFRRLVNFTPRTATGAALQYDTYLDYFVADSGVDCYRDHLQVDSALVKVLTMKEPPSATFPQILEELYTLPNEFVACLEWCRIPNDRMRRTLQLRRRHFFNKRVSMVNYVSPDTRADEMLVDESANATVRQLGDALTELEVNGHFFGECSLALLLYNDDRRALDRAAAESTKVMAAHDGTLIDESYNLLNAWLSILPGNSAHNVRRLPLLETNHADLSFLFTLNTGETRSALLNAEALAVFETRHQSPYHFNLHVQDVGHTLMLGATGSGKSFLLNFLVMHAQKYDPLTVIFDLGHSYRKLSVLLEGSYLELGLKRDTLRINPFSLQPTPENVHFLQAFCRVLLESAHTYRLSDAEDRELYEAIENLYVLDPAQRRLFTLANLLPRALAIRLSRWIEGGRYAELFDNVEDTFNIQQFQVFDFEAMRAYPAMLEPLLFYVLHRVGARIADPDAAGTLKLCVMDEAWRFIQHESLRSYVQEALKTWRKRNAAMLLATQAIDDFPSADLLRTVVESCPTKLLLPNPAFDRKQYADLFQLNETECDLAAGLIPRRQFLLKRADIAKVLTLNVDPRSYWLYTNTPVDNERVRAAFREHGFEAGLDRLAASTQ